MRGSRSKLALLGCAALLALAACDKVKAVAGFPWLQAATPSPGATPELLKAAAAAGVAPAVCSSALPSPALSRISSTASGMESVLRALRARSSRILYSSTTESWNQSGAVTAVSLTPIDASPSGEKHQASAARTSSIFR